MNLRRNLILARLPAKVVPFKTSSNDLQVFKGQGIITGLMVNNGSGANNNFAVYDGEDSNGPLIYQQFISSGNNFNPAFGANGIALEIGVHVTVSASPFSGSIYVVSIADYELPDRDDYLMVHGD